MQELALADVLDWMPYHPRTFTFTPFLPDGFSESLGTCSHCRGNGCSVCGYTGQIRLYLNPNNDQGTCRNCRGSGANFEYLDQYVRCLDGDFTLRELLDDDVINVKTVVEILAQFGPCPYCGGAGIVRVMPPYPMTGRVLVPHPTCEVWCGDIVVFEKGTYDEVKTNDGREFAVMHERNVLCNLGPQKPLERASEPPKILIAS